MLNVRVVRARDEWCTYGDNMMWNPDGIFTFLVDAECKTSEFSKRVVKEIDDSEIISEHLVISPRLGGIPMDYISGGSKCLIIARYLDYEIPAWYFGDNCLELLVEAAEERDITVITGNLFAPFRKVSRPFKIRVTNDSSIVDNNMDLFYKIAEFQK